jgi:hypothetical protein
MHTPSTVFALDDDSGTDTQPSGSDSDLTSFSIVKTITDGNTQFQVAWREDRYRAPKTSFLASHTMVVGAWFRC